VLVKCKLVEAFFDRVSARIDRDRRRLAKRVLPASAKASFEPEPRSLEARHVERCTVLPDRVVMIREHLPKGGVVAEIGVAEGGNARTILESAQPRELHLIDMTFMHLEHVDRAAPGVHFHERDSAEALAAFPDEYFDWIYIDGDHSYEGVVRDIEQAERKVKRDGVLVFNDYILFSYTELLAYGVVAAVNELCRRGWEFRYFAFAPHMYCDVALVRSHV
jgi:hypothetical protein